MIINYEYIPFIGEMPLFFSDGKLNDYNFEIDLLFFLCF